MRYPFRYERLCVCTLANSHCDVILVDGAHTYSGAVGDLNLLRGVAQPQT